MSVLYLTYDGLLEPLGYSPVFHEKDEHWAQRGRRAALAREADQAGIRWVPLRYHKTPSAAATAYDVAVGLAVSTYLVPRHGVRIVHARSYVPAVVAVVLKRIFGTRFVFDMRGFWADERVEGGMWPAESRLFRMSKRFERLFLTHADIVVSLTHAGVAAMQELPYLRERPPHFEVIPTCTDLEAFRPGLSAGPGAAPPRGVTLGYVGNVSLWYTFDPVLEAFKLVREVQPDARLVVVNRGQHAYVRERVLAGDVPEASVVIKDADYASVPAAMAGIDAGVFFGRPGFSQLARAPTRLGEFLGAGIPCLTNAGLGDVERILEEEGVGVVIPGLDAAELRRGVERLLRLMAQPGIHERCRSVAEKYFDLARGIAAYDRIYRTLS
jgi:glycosyltransferase involved in cell wall biosynthesis